MKSEGERYKYTRVALLSRKIDLSTTTRLRPFDWWGAADLPRHTNSTPLAQPQPRTLVDGRGQRRMCALSCVENAKEASRDISATRPC
eukprot:9471595-Pyramimonas_sp.AAC.1